MSGIDAKHVQDVLVRAVAQETFQPNRSAVEALHRCLHPDGEFQPVVPQRAVRAGDVSSEQRSALEHHINQLVFGLGSQAEASNTRVFDYVHPKSAAQPVLPRLFDIVLYLCDSHYLEPGFVFTVIERLVEMTMAPEECHGLIDWILGNKDTLKHSHIFDRGKLILLRTVNRMLKLLQKGEDHGYHSGQLLFFMSELYPMAERSATNHTGLRDLTHPVKHVPWTEPLHDDFGRAVEKADYDLYWRTLDHVQRSAGSESEVMRALDLVQRLLDYFKSHIIRREGALYLTRTDVTCVNDTTPEQFNDIIRDPDCRMECVVQIYVFVQKLLAPHVPSVPSRAAVDLSDNARGRLADTLKDVETYVKSDPELKLRWGPIHECLSQEPKWIEWKNDGAKDWTLQPTATPHPWSAAFCRETDATDISQIHACLNDHDPDHDMDLPPQQDDPMQSCQDLHIGFDRDLEAPDFSELHVPSAKAFLDGALGEEDVDAASLEIFEADTSFCWRTYRLLSEHDIQHMVDGEHRTNFGKLLKSTPLRNALD